VAEILIHYCINDASQSILLQHSSNVAFMMLFEQMWNRGLNTKVHFPKLTQEKFAACNTAINNIKSAFEKSDEP